MELTLDEVKQRLKYHLENRTYRDYFNDRETMLKYREEFFRVYSELAELDRSLSVTWHVRPTFGRDWFVCDGVVVKDLSPNDPLNDFRGIL